MPTLDNSLADQLVRLLFQIAKLVNVQPDYFFRGLEGRLIPRVMRADRCGPLFACDGCDPFGLGDELSPCVADRVYDGVVVLEDGI
jgi:hypothetical protein